MLPGGAGGRGGACEPRRCRRAPRGSCAPRRPKQDVRQAELAVEAAQANHAAAAARLEDLRAEPSGGGCAPGRAGRGGGAGESRRGHRAPRGLCARPAEEGDVEQARCLPRKRAREPRQRPGPLRRADWRERPRTRSRSRSRACGSPRSPWKRFAPHSRSLTVFATFDWRRRGRERAAGRPRDGEPRGVLPRHARAGY